MGIDIKCYSMNDTVTYSGAAQWNVYGTFNGVYEGRPIDAPISGIKLEEGQTPGVLELSLLIESEYEMMTSGGAWYPDDVVICISGGEDANDPGFLAFMDENTSGGGGDEGINVCADPRYAMIVPIPDGSLVAGEGDTTFGQAYTAFQNGTGVFLTYEGDNGTVICPVTGITEEEGTYTITYVDGATNEEATVSGAGTEDISIGGGGE